MHTSYRISAALTVLAALFCFSSTTQAERLSVKTYTIADGLSRDFINRIRQDSHGYIWFCTAEGISRFDGYTFKNYGLADGLPHRVVTDLLITRDGSYLFGTNNGLVQFLPDKAGADGSHFVRIPMPTGPQTPDPEVSVTELIEARDGTIWVGSHGGLFQLTRDGDKWITSFADKDSEGRPFAAIGTLLEDNNGSIWLGSGSKGLFRRLADGKFESYTVANGLAQDGISKVFQDNDGTIWVGTGDGLSRLVTDPKPGTHISARNYTMKDGLSANFIEAVLRSSDGRLWVATRGGLNTLNENAGDGPAFRAYGPANGLPLIRMIALLEDKDRNIWVGAENGGAIKIPLGSFLSFFEADGFSNGRMTQILADRANRVYAMAVEPGTFQPLILRYDGQAFVPDAPKLPHGSKLTWGWNQLVLQDRENYWWVGTSDGLYRFTGSVDGAGLSGARPDRRFGAQDGMLGKEIFRLFEDAHGDLWFSTLDGPKAYIQRWQRETGRFSTYAAADNLPDSIASAFAVDPNGDLWVGFYAGGIARYRNGKFDKFTSDDGLPEGFIRHLFFDSKKRLWVASSIGGVGRVDDPFAEKLSFANLTSRDGISSDQVTTIIEDKWGRIYLGNGRGVDRLEPETNRFRHFTTSDGLADNFVNVSFADAGGTLWFGTLRGVSKFVPRQDDQPHAPPIRVSAVIVGSERHPVSELGATDVSLPELLHTQNQVQIDFVSLGMVPGEIIRYQYRFENTGDWSPASDQRTLTLANLTDGSYKFLVRAVNSDGLASDSPATVTFRILPPIWARWWFIALCIVFTAGLAGAFYRYRTARLREVNLALEEANRAEESLRLVREERIVELEKVRSRIATDLHDDIGASLTQIAVLSEVARTQGGAANGKVAGPLGLISDVSNELVETMSDIVWSINPAKDHLHDLTQRMRRFASDVLTAKGVVLNFTVPADSSGLVIGTSLRREVFLIFKESVNNIVKHSCATAVRIALEIDGPRLSLVITDNGKGFAAATSAQTDSMGGNGLQSMRRRAREMHGDVDIVSDNGNGTTVTLWLPLDAPVQTGGESWVQKR